MTEEASMQEYVESAQDILETLLRLLAFEDARVEARVEDDQIYFQVVTADAARIIGRTSQTLDALQFLVNRLMSRKYEESPYCVVDAEQYRQRRREKLEADAYAALERVRQTGHPWRMPPLHSMERRIIHHALRDYTDVHTHSEDEDGDGRKRVVISPVSPGTAAPPPPEPAANPGNPV